MDKPVEGEAAFLVTPKGHLQLVLSLAPSWVDQVKESSGNRDYDPDVRKALLSVNVTLDGYTSVFRLDRQAWPVLATSHDGKGDGGVISHGPTIYLEQVFQQGDKGKKRARETEDLRDVKDPLSPPQRSKRGEGDIVKNEPRGEVIVILDTDSEPGLDLGSDDGATTPPSPSTFVENCLMEMEVDVEEGGPDKPEPGFLASTGSYRASNTDIGRLDAAFGGIGRGGPSTSTPPTFKALATVADPSNLSLLSSSQKPLVTSQGSPIVSQNHAARRKSPSAGPSKPKRKPRVIKARDTGPRSAPVRKSKKVKTCKVAAVDVNGSFTGISSPNDVDASKPSSTAPITSESTGSRTSTMAQAPKKDQKMASLPWGRRGTKLPRLSSAMVLLPSSKSKSKDADPPVTRPIFEQQAESGDPSASPSISLKRVTTTAFGSTNQPRVSLHEGECMVTPASQSANGMATAVALSADRGTSTSPRPGRPVTANTAVPPLAAGCPTSVSGISAHNTSSSSSVPSTSDNGDSILSTTEVPRPDDVDMLDHRVMHTSTLDPAPKVSTDQTPKPSPAMSHHPLSSGPPAHSSRSGASSAQTKPRTTPSTVKNSEAVAESTSVPSAQCSYTPLRVRSTVTASEPMSIAAPSAPISGPKTARSPRSINHSSPRTAQVSSTQTRSILPSSLSPAGNIAPDRPILGTAKSTPTEAASDPTRPSASKLGEPSTSPKYMIKIPAKCIVAEMPLSMSKSASRSPSTSSPRSTVKESIDKAVSSQSAGGPFHHTPRPPSARTPPPTLERIATESPLTDDPELGTSVTPPPLVSPPSALAAPFKLDPDPRASEGSASTQKSTLAERASVIPSRSAPEAIRYKGENV